MQGYVQKLWLRKNTQGPHIEKNTTTSLPGRVKDSIPALQTKVAGDNVTREMP